RWGVCVSFTSVTSYNARQELQTRVFPRSVAREPPTCGAPGIFSQALVTSRVTQCLITGRYPEWHNWHARCFCLLSSATTNPQANRGSVPSRSGEPFPQGIRHPHDAGRHRSNVKVAMALPPGPRPRERFPPSPEALQTTRPFPCLTAHSPRRRLPQGGGCLF